MKGQPLRAQPFSSSPERLFHISSDSLSGRRGQTAIPFRARNEARPRRPHGAVREPGLASHPRTTTMKFLFNGLLGIALSLAAVLPAAEAGPGQQQQQGPVQQYPPKGPVSQWAYAVYWLDGCIPQYCGTYASFD